MGDTEPILDAPWPPDLNPSSVPFRQRTITIPTREGVWCDMTLLDQVTAQDVLGWWYAGEKTVEDLRETGNLAILRHILEIALERPVRQVERRRDATRGQAQEALRRLLDRIAQQPWSAPVWWGDPRFKDLLPRSRHTVRELSNEGTVAEQQLLLDHIVELKWRVRRFERLPLEQAVAGYVEALSSQRGVRLEMLLACTGLNGQDPIRLREAAETLGVSHQRVHKIKTQLWRNRDRSRPLGGIWMPQVDEAMAMGWPNGYTAAGIEAIRRFFER